MKQFVVVAYDIVDDRRRQKISKILVQYGIRCNKSVFECLLTESKIQKMKGQILKTADKDEDIILYYFLCKPCVMKSESLGRRPDFQPAFVIV
jgi:CRISPR-associated protein Cas2